MVVKKSKSGIKSWAEDDRPREKLSLKGKTSLSDAELIAILLGSGSPQETAVDLAKRILASVDNNLNELGRLGEDELCLFRGVGTAKAISVITALELGRRRRLSSALERKKISGSVDAYELLQPIIGDLPHEEFWVIFLSTSNKVISRKSISKGGLNGTMADVRMIFKEAILQNSPAIILAHNHPSGAVRPSHQDKSITHKMIEAGKIMDINVIDHLIIAEQQYFSFADEGLL